MVSFAKNFGLGFTNRAIQVRNNTNEWRRKKALEELKWDRKEAHERALQQNRLTADKSNIVYRQNQQNERARKQQEHSAKQAEIEFNRQANYKKQQNAEAATAAYTMAVSTYGLSPEVAKTFKSTDQLMDTLNRPGIFITDNGQITTLDRHRMTMAEDTLKTRLGSLGAGDITELSAQDIRKYVAAKNTLMANGGDVDRFDKEYYLNWSKDTGLEFEPWAVRNTKLATAKALQDLQAKGLTEAESQAIKLRLDVLPQKLTGTELSEAMKLYEGDEDQSALILRAQQNLGVANAQIKHSFVKEYKELKRANPNVDPELLVQEVENRFLQATNTNNIKSATIAVAGAWALTDDAMAADPKTVDIAKGKNYAYQLGILYQLSDNPNFLRKAEELMSGINARINEAQIRAEQAAMVSDYDLASQKARRTGIGEAFKAFTSGHTLLPDKWKKSTDVND